MESASQNSDFLKDPEDKPVQASQPSKSPTSSKKEDNSDIVICNKCHLIPDNYIALNCQHNFCLPCLAQVFFKIIESKNFQYENQAIVVNCSVCGKQTELDKPSMDALEEAILVLGGLGQDLEQKQGKQNSFEPIPEDSKEQIQTEENYQPQKTDKTKNQQSRKNSNSSQQFQQDLLDDLQKNEFDRIDTQSEPNLAEKQKEDNKRNKGNQNKQLERQNQQLNQFHLKNMKNSQNNSIKNNNEVEKQQIQLENNSIQQNTMQNTKNQDQQLEQATQQSQNAEYKCPEHPTESNLLFCFTCNVSNFCVECLMKGNHKNHLVRSIDNSEDILKERYQELTNQLKGKKDIISLIQNKIFEKKDNMNQTLQSTLKLVDDSFKEIFLAVENQQNKFNQFFEKIINDKTAKLDEALTKISQQQQFFTKTEEKIKLQKASNKTRAQIYDLFTFQKNAFKDQLNIFEFQTETNIDEIPQLIKEMQHKTKKVIDIVQNNELTLDDLKSNQSLIQNLEKITTKDKFPIPQYFKINLDPAKFQPIAINQDLPSSVLEYSGNKNSFLIQTDRIHSNRNSFYESEKISDCQFESARYSNKKSEWKEINNSNGHTAKKFKSFGGLSSEKIVPNLQLFSIVKNDRSRTDFNDLSLSNPKPKQQSLSSRNNPISLIKTTYLSPKGNFNKFHKYSNTKFINLKDLKSGSEAFPKRRKHYSLYSSQMDHNQSSYFNDQKLNTESNNSLLNLTSSDQPRQSKVQTTQVQIQNFLNEQKRQFNKNKLK